MPLALFELCLGGLLRRNTIAGLSEQDMYCKIKNLKYEIEKG